LDLPAPWRYLAAGTQTLAVTRDSIDPDTLYARIVWCSAAASATLHGLSNLISRHSYLEQRLTLPDSGPCSWSLPIGRHRADDGAHYCELRLRMLYVASCGGHYDPQLLSTNLGIYRALLHPALVPSCWSRLGFRHDGIHLAGGLCATRNTCLEGATASRHVHAALPKVRGW
jgi:hypothetical protein